MLAILVIHVLLIGSFIWVLATRARQLVLWLKKSTPDHLGRLDFAQGRILLTHQSGIEDGFLVLLHKVSPDTAALAGCRADSLSNHSLKSNVTATSRDQEEAALQCPRPNRTSQQDDRVSPWARTCRHGHHSDASSSKGTC